MVVNISREGILMVADISREGIGKKIEITIFRVLSKILNLFSPRICETFCGIWQDLYNLENVKITLGGVILY